MGQVLEVVGVESMEEKAVIPNTELGFLQRYWGAFSSSLDFFSSKGFLSKASTSYTELGFLLISGLRHFYNSTPSLDFFSSKGFLSMGRGVSGSLNEAFAFSFCSSHRRVRVHC